MTILITGVAGFIGYHLARRFLSQGLTIVGVDNLNDYYEVTLKQARLADLQTSSQFQFQFLNLSDQEATSDLFRHNSFTHVIHLAAQVGVRASLKHPMAYVDSNLVGFSHILEGCRDQDSLHHLIYASSSSVYGANRKIPFSTTDPVDLPLSPYAATKRANELMAYRYSYLYQLPTTGLRFFTVYGPWGRPDMAYFKFVRAIEADQPIEIYNFGQMQRDLTYVEDVIEGIVRLMDRVPRATTGSVPYRLYNIGTNQPIGLGYLITVIEQTLGKTAEKIYLPMQPGDMPVTQADIDDLIADIGFKPSTSIQDGIEAFVRWYRDFYPESGVAPPLTPALVPLSTESLVIKASYSDRISNVSRSLLPKPLADCVNALWERGWG